MDLELAIGLGIGLAALAFAAYPLLRRHEDAPRAGDERALDRLVDDAGVALAAGTVCPRCYAANPADSRFCGTCGASLARPEAGAGESEADD